MELPPLPTLEQIGYMALIMIFLFIIICWLIPSVEDFQKRDKMTEQLGEQMTEQKKTPSPKNDEGAKLN